jgi:ABC-type protease/lipase transport system fused ATPase/permease subunit
VVVVAAVSRFVSVLVLSALLSMLQIYGRVLVSRNHEIPIFLIIAAVGALMVLLLLDFARLRILAHPGGRRA